MKSLLLSALGIEPEELPTAARMLLLCMGSVAASFVVGRTVANALFLQRLDPAWVPYTYIASALVSSLVASVYASAADRVRRDRALVAVFAALAAVLVLARVALALAGRSAALLGGLYLLFDVSGDLSMILFWSLANELFTGRQGKRVFGFVAGGGTIAAVVFGWLVRVAAPRVGTQNLLLLAAAIAVGCTFLARDLGTRHGPLLEELRRGCARASGPSARRSVGADLRSVARSRYLLVIAATASVASVSTILVDYQWKMAARAAFLGNEDGLASYFGSFSLATGGLAFAVQFLLAGRILRRLGVHAALLFLPASLLVAAATALPAAAAPLFLWIATATKGADGVLRYGVYDTAAQVLYQPLPTALRNRAKALIDGVAKPVWVVVAGLLIAASAGWLGPRGLAWFVVPFAALWGLFVLGARSQYARALAEALRTRRFDAHFGPVALESSARRQLGRALVGDDPRDAACALALLEEVGAPHWSPPLYKLLESQDPELRRRALALVARLRLTDQASAVEPCLQDPDPCVRAAALRAWAELRPPGLLPRLVGFARDPHPEVKAEAIAAAISHCGIDGVLAVADELKQLFGHADWRLREAAARVLEAVRVRSFHQPLHALLRDADARVRLAAVQAAGAVKNAELAPALLERLAEPRTRRAAAAALLSMGAPAMAAIATALDDPSTPPAIRRHIPDVLSRARSGLAAERLASRLGDPDLELRRAAAASLARLGCGLPPGVPRSAVLSLCRREIDSHLALQTLARDLGPVRAELLDDALERRLDARAGHVLDLLAVLHPRRQLEPCKAALASRDRARRSNALELLDHVLEDDLRRAVLGMFEGARREDESAAGEQQADAGADARRVGRLRELLSDPDPWLVACALYEIGRSRHLGLGEAVQGCLEHHRPLVREAASSALRRLERAATAGSRAGASDRGSNPARDDALSPPVTETPDD